MKKLFTLLALAVLSVGSTWAADYVVTATRTLSNSNKTSNWSAITANGGTAFQSSQTALGEGLYFVAVGKITLNGGSSLNVKANGEMYLEVPSATAAGTVKFTNGANDRYMETASGGKVHMKGDSDNGDYKATLAWTSADIVAVDGVNYLKLTSKSDCKFKTVEIVLTSGAYMTILAAPTITVNGATAKATITPPANASSVRYTLDGTEPSASNGTVYSTEFDVAEGDIIKAIAIGDGETYANSSVVTQQVLLTGIKMATPTAVQYNGTVLLSTTSPSASIYYTIDGSTPTSSSTLYKYPFTLEANATIKALAVRDGCTDSDVLTEDVTTVISNTKTKTIYMGYGSFNTSNAKALVGKSGDEAEGYGLSCSNDLQTGTHKNTSINKTYIKLPNGNQVTLTLPTGVKATKITFYSFINSSTSSTVCGWKEVNGVNYQSGEGAYTNIPMGAFSDVEGFKDAPDVRSYALDNVEGSITFTNGGTQMCTIIALDVIEAPVAITPAYDKTTYVTTNKLDFSAVSGLKAYAATAASGSTVTIEEVGAVPANTPLILIGTAGTEYSVPVATAASAPATNLLKAGDGSTVFDGSTFDYILAADGMFHQISSGTVATGKAYLHLDSAPARELSIVFADDTVTSINEELRMMNGESANAIYNLSGQRVAQPQKGLYIMNGKKILVK